jgi:hypothetical protein
MYKQHSIPGFPDGAQKVCDALYIVEKDGWVQYFLWDDNYFSHLKDDVRCRRFILTSLMENGHVRASELEREPLLIPHRTLMNWKVQHRKVGPGSFLIPSQKSSKVVMTPEKSAQCGALLAQGLSISEAARQVAIDDSTLRKAVTRGAVLKLAPVLANGPENGGEAASNPSSSSTKSERSRSDAAAADGIGTACTRADERIEAALGLAICATTRFEASCDVPMAGLLAALPALCANGLLSGLGKYLSLPKGFYSALHILLVLGFMALGRIRRPEGLRSIPPGEFGKLIGLDRVPEVRTLRRKIGHLALTGNPQAWMQELSKQWMQADPTEAGYLYVDGHVRVYCGDLANLPKRFVSRERLCLRGTTDYWVNDAIGQPFFVVSKAVSEGMGDALITDIVPQLLASVPAQPSQKELDEDEQLHRFVIVFDRECSNYSLIAELWKSRIGALTYRKNVKDKWPTQEFVEHVVPIIGGDSTKMKLAMRETTLSAGKQSINVTEVRRLCDSGHQTAIITSAKKLGNIAIASRMFARWCQENFFAYMMQHYDIDGLIEYGVQELPGTTLVVNPDRRDLEKTIFKTRVMQRKHQSELAKYTLEAQVKDDKEEQQGKKESKNLQKRAECVESIQAIQADLAILCAKREDTPKKVTIDSLPKETRPTQLAPLGKMLSDTVKMIAYRCETAMVAMLRGHLNKEEEARALVRQLFVSSGDIEPNNAAKTLTIKIHRMATPAHDKAISALLSDLTSEEFCHPETGAKMIYTLV